MNCADEILKSVFVAQLSASCSIADLWDIEKTKKAGDLERTEERFLKCAVVKTIKNRILLKGANWLREGVCLH